MKEVKTVRIINVMADGTIKESINGTVIQNEEFYRILNAIQNKKSPPP